MVYLLLSLLASIINEFIANLLSLRGRNLRNAIAHMLQSGNGEFELNRFLDDPYLKRLSKRPFFTKVREVHSDYIPKAAISDVLARAVFRRNSGVAPVNELEKQIDRMFAPEGETNQILKRFARDAQGNIDLVRQRVEAWYDETTTLATDWYKRRVRLILLAIGFVMCAFVNADTFVIAQRLWVDPTARATLDQLADQYVESGVLETGGLDSLSVDARMDSLMMRRERILARIESTDDVLGMGWGDFGGARTLRAKARHVFHEARARVWGWLVTTLAISMGAPFWFDVLNRVVRLRHAGQEAEEKQKNEPVAVG